MDNLCGLITESESFPENSKWCSLFSKSSEVKGKVP